MVRKINITPFYRNISRTLQYVEGNVHSFPQNVNIKESIKSQFNKVTFDGYLDKFEKTKEVYEQTYQRILHKGNEATLKWLQEHSYPLEEIQQQLHIFREISYNYLVHN